MMQQYIALIDMDAFFASIEIRDNPQLKGKPVLIAGSHSQKGVVTTCSYEARKYGCHSGMSVFEARKLCPNGIYISGSHGKYVYASMRIVDICNRFSPVVEPFSVDEMFLDVSGCIRLFGSLEAIGEGIRGAIRDELKLPSSVGIAPNKTLAKLASRLAKPDGLYIIHPEDVEGLLKNLPVQQLFGVGPKTTEKLNLLGIFTAGELARYPVEVLRRKFGVGGTQLHELACGRDNSAVVAHREADKPKSISNETTLFEATNNRVFLKKVLLSLVHKVSFRMRKHGAVARTVRLTLRTHGFETHQYHHTLDHKIFFETDLYTEIVRLFDNVHFEPARLRLVGVGVTNLSFDEEPLQLRIFPDFDEKKVRMAQAVDDLKKRFGDSVIRIGDCRSGDYKYRPTDKPALSFGMKNYIAEEAATRKKDGDE